MRIRASIYLDEDVDLIIADMLRSQGYSALTAQEAGRKGKNDHDQLEFAVQKEMVVLTHNRIDFQKLAIKYFESGRSHFGIILAIQRPPREISSRTLTILERFSADEMKDQLYRKEEKIENNFILIKIAKPLRLCTLATLR